MKSALKPTLAVVLIALASLTVLVAMTQPLTTTGGNPPMPPPRISTIAPPVSSGSTPPVARMDDDAPPEQSDGALRTIAPDGTAGAFCPLKHTAVNAEISGFLARVTLTQEFVNPTSDRVEAIYTFPLPQHAAVDDMTMLVGGRTIKGLIKKREEAQKIYENARNAGHTAALLEQERPNIFTQSVANIPPNAPVKVVISYIETLKYEAGTYEFVYPMVVGPRYIPGQPIGKQSGGWSADTNQVPDGSRITPPVAGVHYGQKGSRAGHDISLNVKLDAGVPIQKLESPLHEIDIQNTTASLATVKLRKQQEIPNRDFVLKYDVSGGKIEDALLTHAGTNPALREGRGGADSAATRGFFTFILQPPDRVRDEDVTSRELIFVLDTSGSMSGYPIETAKKVMRRAIENMRAGDTFNLITFAGDTHILFPQPVQASAANIQQAVQFLEGRRGGGGTEMMKAIRAALGSDASGCGPYAECDRANAASIRVVCFMTDGYVGNDMEIIGEVQKHSNARVFSFGIGSSVNRFLLDGMARAGRGEVEYVLTDADAPTAAERFYERVHTPVLTDVSIDWNGLPVADVMPAKPLDLFTAKPLVISGRYTHPSVGTIKLRGKRAGKPFEREIRVNLPALDNDNQALAQLWARTKIADIMAQDWQGLQNGSPRQDVRDQVTQLGLDYRLMTQFTSFVAVEEQTVVEGGTTRTIHVPVEMPQGVSPEGVFGANASEAVAMKAANGYRNLAPSAAPVPAQALTYGGQLSSPAHRKHQGGIGAGVGAGIGRGDVAHEQQASVRDEKDKLEKRSALTSKLHPALLAAYDCWQKGSTAANCAGVKNGKVHIQIWLNSTTPQLQQQLAQLGFTPAHKSGVAIANRLQLSGEIAIAKLPELAALANVKLIGLQK